MPTDSPLTLGDLGTPSPCQARGLDPLQAAWPKSNAPGRPGPDGRGGILGPATCPPRRAVRSRRAEAQQSYLPAGLVTATEPVVALRKPGKVHTACRRQRAGHVRDESRPARGPARRAEFPGRTLRIHPFDSMRFHVLLNSLFKVLFNFPSRYLSAIGLVPVFSLRWSLPPTWGCIPKQPDSEAARRRSDPSRQGPDTRSG